MGLDAYVFSKAKDSDPVEIWYGRKINEIHNWMQQQSGVPANDFNCVKVPLTKELLEKLEQDSNSGPLPSVGGFFFGDANEQDYVKESVRNLISASKEAIERNEEPYYNSWW